MRIVYEAFDGKTFVDKEACLSHEFDVVGDDLQLYDAAGIKTDDVKYTQVAYIENEKARELLCNLERTYCPERDGKFAGVGLNILSSYKNEWVWVSPKCLMGLSNIFKSEDETK